MGIKLRGRVYIQSLKFNLQYVYFLMEMELGALSVLLCLIQDLVLSRLGMSICWLSEQSQCP